MIQRLVESFPAISSRHCFRLEITYFSQSSKRLSTGKSQLRPSSLRIRYGGHAVVSTSCTHKRSACQDLQPSLNSSTLADVALPPSTVAGASRVQERCALARQWGESLGVGVRGRGGRLALPGKSRSRSDDRTAGVRSTIPGGS